MNIISIAKSRLVTKTQPVAGAKYGLTVLNEFFRQLGERLKANTCSKNQEELMLLKASVGDIIHLAYRDWKEFSDKYTCSVGYNGSLDTSKVFKLTLVETANGFDREFTFCF